MLLQITARPDAKLIATSLRRCLRAPLWSARVVGWLSIGLSVLAGGAGVDPILLTSGLLLAVGLPMLVVHHGTRRRLREGHLTTYEISEGGVASSDVDCRQAYTWRAFSYVQHSPQGLIFGRSRTRLLPVPTTGLHPAQIEQVLTAAAGHGLQVRRA
jgi:hypothetical protein